MANLENLRRTLSSRTKFYEGINISSNKYFIEFKNIYAKVFSGIKIEDTFEIPKICVVGAESVGKSSLLENITKTPIFPKDRDVCTKQPIHLIIKNGLDESCYIDNVSIDKSEIRNTVQSKMNILDGNISNEKITINITSKNLINFEFFDLPGIRSYPPELKQKTESLSESFISDKNNIILCVVPATVTRLTSYPPIALIQKHKMEKNTILVFTMADRISEEDIEDLVINRISNNSNEINLEEYLGCSTIINRTHHDKKTFSENDLFSKEWFLNNVEKNVQSHQLKDMILNNIGLPNLKKNLDIYYKKFIDKNWIPKTIDSLGKKIEELTSELHSLGIKPEDIDKSKLEEFYNAIILQWIDNLTNISQGNDYIELNHKKKVILKGYNNFNDLDNYFSYLLKCFSVKESNDFNTQISPIYIPNNNNKINYVRLENINNCIQTLLLKIYYEKMNKYIKSTKSSIYTYIMLSSNQSVLTFLTNMNNLCKNEMCVIDFKQFKFFEIVEESDEFKLKRKNLKEEIKKNRNAIIDLENSNQGKEEEIKKNRNAIIDLENSNQGKEKDEKYICLNSKQSNVFDDGGGGDDY